MNNHKAFLKLLISFLIITLIKNELRIPFKTDRYSSISSTKTTQESLNNYVMNLIYKNIYIEFEIGSPTIQKIKSYLKLEEYPFFIQGKDIPLAKYDQTKSDTYKSELYPHVFLDGEEQIKWGYVSNDTIKIQNNLIKEFNFVLVTETITNSPSNIGLMIPSEYTSIKDINFIIQLKKKEIIDYYSFVINYTSYEKDEGEFIIGGPPHFYNAEYNNDYYKSQYAIQKPKYMMYGLHFSLINYGNNKTNIGGSMQSKFLSDFGLIVGTINYYNIILEKFFNDYITKGICYIKNLKANIEWREGENNFEFFYCVKNKVNIRKLENIKFIHEKLNFTFEFNYSELFDEIDNYYVFKIIFQKTKNFYWIFGKLWLAKYLMVFDQDKKTIGHYYNSGNLAKEENKNKVNIKLLVIICSLLLIIFFIILGLFFSLNRRKRTNRLNEINDDYEYAQDNNNQNNLINNNLVLNN